jgi:ring-1,2-phenylacetyl-CoA epoxidase subunit PaaD
VRVDVVLAPAWTTDWMTDAGKRKLVEYGIAPPTGRARQVRSGSASA